jgi:serine/threonine-protein kinase RsbT
MSMNTHRITGDTLGSGMARKREAEAPRRQGEIRVLVEADTDVVRARRKGRALACLLGFTPAEATVVAAVISELARNILRYAGHGELTVAPADDAGRRGVAVTARDDGQGLAGHPAGPATRLLELGTAGCRLDRIRRVMDEFEIVSDVGKGTVVTVRKWKQR